MKAVVNDMFKKFKVPYEVLIRSSDKHKDSNLFPGISVVKNTDGKVHIEFNIPAVHLKESLTDLTELSIKLTNLATNQPLNISKTEKQEVVLEPDSHYELIMEINFSGTQISGTRTLTCNFIPEK